MSKAKVQMPKDAITPSGSPFQGEGLIVELSGEFMEFHNQERGLWGVNANKIREKQETLYMSEGGGVWLFRSDGRYWLHWGPERKEVQGGWAVSWMDRIAGKSDAEAFEMLKYDKELGRVKFIKQ